MEKNGNYELLYIVHPDLESSIDKCIDKVRSYIEKKDGKIIYEENWGKKKLAYPIKKNDVGIYVLYYFDLPKNRLAGLEKDLRLNEEIMRFMILTSPEKKEAKPKKEKKVAKEVAEKPTVKEPAPKKETEKERMKKIDEKLEALLGDEETTK